MSLVGTHFTLSNCRIPHSLSVIGHTALLYSPLYAHMSVNVRVGGLDGVVGKAEKPANGRPVLRIPNVVHEEVGAANPAHASHSPTTQQTSTLHLQLTWRDAQLRMMEYMKAGLVMKLGRAASAARRMMKRATRTTYLRPLPLSGLPREVWGRETRPGRREGRRGGRPESGGGGSAGMRPRPRRCSRRPG